MVCGESNSNGKGVLGNRIDALIQATDDKILYSFIAHTTCALHVNNVISYNFDNCNSSCGRSNAVTISNNENYLNPFALQCSCIWIMAFAFVFDIILNRV